MHSPSTCFQPQSCSKSKCAERPRPRPSAHSTATMLTIFGSLPSPLPSLQPLPCHSKPSTRQRTICPLSALTRSLTRAPSFESVSVLLLANAIIGSVRRAPPTLAPLWTTFRLRRRCFSATLIRIAFVVVAAAVVIIIQMETSLFGIHEKREEEEKLGSVRPSSCLCLRLPLPLRHVE